MGLRLVGAIVVFTLIAIGLYWVINNVRLRPRGEKREDRDER